MSDWDYDDDDRNVEAKKVSRKVILIVGIVLLLLVAGIAFRSFGFIAHKVQANEVAVILNKGRVVEVVGPGIYSRFGLWWEVQDIKIEGITACAEDGEVLTSDQQRIGVTTCATVHRPDASVGLDDYAAVYSDFKSLLTNDDLLVGIKGEDGTLITRGKFQEIAAQAMKSCIGDRTFNDAAVGASRDELRACLEENENKLGEGFRISFRNVTVPNIEIHPSVQGKLDLITEEKFETDFQRQLGLRLAAEAQAELTRQEGEILVSQGKLQEQQRQRAITADLEREAIEAELVVIEAQRANELRDAELTEEVAIEQLAVQQARALAGLAPETALAALYESNPEYVEYLIKLSQAASWTDVDKVFLYEGLTPEAVLSPDGTVNIVVEPGR